VCLLHPRWRHCVRYLFSFAFSFAVCWAIMQLAPEKFLNWWWD
jgi:hypothetical protein